MYNIKDIKNTIIQGDCIEEMKKFPDNSIDTIITDPPYGLEFMGKAWDKFPSNVGPKKTFANQSKEQKLGGNGYQEWVEQWAKEALRIAKPGATLLCFGGTRTFHRLACGLEDAGWIIKDTLMWLYGCLSGDTEILTERGWKRLHKITKYDRIKIYDIKNNIFKWETPKRWTAYSVDKHTCYRIRSDKTDQIVSKEHRCLVEREGKLVFKQAWELESMERVPVLPQDFFNKKKIYWSLLFKKLCWKGKKLVERYSSFVLGKEVRKKEAGVEGILEKKNDWLKKSSVEGWFNLSEEKGAICKSIYKICSLPKRVYEYGKKRWICNGTQIKSGKRNWKTFIKNRMCSSYKSQCRGQQGRKLNVIPKQSRPQKIREWSGYKTTLATVEKIEYTGTLFCPTVSTGIFVARRNGKVFITGNSGFPKATDISKQIDKIFGAKRRVVGKNPNHREIVKKGYGSVQIVNYKQNGEITRPATPEAKLWNGWKSHGLKPAYEPIIMAMKPNDGTYANNALKWGVAGLNIDGGRIPSSWNWGKTKTDIRGKNGLKTGWKQIKVKEDIVSNSKGRFPANILLDEEAAKMLDEQSGISKSTGGRIGKKDRSNIDFGLSGKYQKGDPGFGDKGGASRFFYVAKASKRERNMGEIDNKHPTVKPLKLMEYLVKLTSMPSKNQIYLDPFCGSGTTCMAVKKLGRNYIGIEKEEYYIKIAEARIKAVQPPLGL